MPKSRSIPRYTAAFLLLSYGIAELDGVQFLISPEQLQQPMGQVTGFWLTWYYYGYSHIYAGILGAIQVFAGTLLMFRRTSLIAALIATPVVANILLIDVFFRISWPASAIALYLMLVCSRLLMDNRSALLHLLWRSQPPELDGNRALRWSVRLCVVFLAIVQAVFEIMRSH
jgi:hypothetical protein